MKRTLEQANQIMDENDGNLNLDHTGIPKLPDGLKVSGDLDLRPTDLTSLPEGLYISSSLNLDDLDLT